METGKNRFRTDGVIDTFPNQHQDREYLIEFVAPEFTSMCPMTGLPDFGTLTITYRPGARCIELRSFKYYLQAFRNEGIFYEDVVNRVLDDIVAALEPRSAQVRGDFNARGGIRATVIASYGDSGCS